MHWNPQLAPLKELLAGTYLAKYAVLSNNLSAIHDSYLDRSPIGTADEINSKLFESFENLFGLMPLPKDKCAELWARRETQVSAAKDGIAVKSIAYQKGGMFG